MLMWRQPPSAVHRAKLEGFLSRKLRHSLSLRALPAIHGCPYETSFASKIKRWAKWRNPYQTTKKRQRISAFWLRPRRGLGSFCRIFLACLARANPLPCPLNPRLQLSGLMSSLTAAFPGDGSCNPAHITFSCSPLFGRDRDFSPCNPASSPP